MQIAVCILAVVAFTSCVQGATKTTKSSSSTTTTYSSSSHSPPVTTSHSSYSSSHNYDSPSTSTSFKSSYATPTETITHYGLPGGAGYNSHTSWSSSSSSNNAGGSSTPGFVIPPTSGANSYSHKSSTTYNGGASQGSTTSSSSSTPGFVVPHTDSTSTSASGLDAGYMTQNKNTGFEFPMPPQNTYSNPSSTYDGQYTSTGSTTSNTGSPYPSAGGPGNPSSSSTYGGKYTTSTGSTTSYDATSYPSTGPGSYYPMPYPPAGGTSSLTFAQYATSPQGDQPAFMPSSGNSHGSNGQRQYYSSQYAVRDSRFGSSSRMDSNEGATIARIMAGAPAGTKVIVLYENTAHTGRGLVLPVGIEECAGLPRDFNDVISAVNTYGSCFVLCEHADCLGKCKRFTGGTGTVERMYVGDLFNDKVSSVKQC